jgi:hypothetical protein
VTGPLAQQFARRRRTMSDVNFLSLVGFLTGLAWGIVIGAVLS